MKLHSLYHISTTALALLCLTRGVAAQAPGFTTLVEFTGTSGSRVGGEPVASLIQGTDGNFYGTTLSGGTANVGTIFKVTPSGTFTNLHMFTGATGSGVGYYPYAGLTQHTDGMLYGETNGLFDEAAAAITNAGFGAPFKISTTGTGYTKFFNFSGPSQTNKGRTPKGALVLASDGSFYGTTEFGGAGAASSMGHGTLFRMSPAGIMTYLVDFSNNGSSNKGSQPNARLVDGGDGFLYGSTFDGGASDAGTLFKIKVSNGAFTTLAQFTGNSGTTPGKNPTDALFVASDGNIYGTTVNGGSLGWGTVFRLTSGGTVTTLVHFTNLTGGAQGAAPFGGLAQGNDGNLYGTTRYGGESASTDHGTIYRLTPGGVLTPRLIDFSGTTGSFKGRGPVGGLIKGADGHLYGTTLQGGSGPDNGYGTVYRLNISPQVPPVVTTGAASDVTGSSAMLNGTVNPQGVAATWQFEYGATTSYGSLIPATPGNISAGSTAEPVSTSFSSLPTGSTWHYRLKAVNGGGTTYGDDAVFTTLAAPQSPQVETVAATAVTGTSAVLNGTVNPRGAPTTWQFEYGMDESYGSAIPLPPGSMAAGGIAEAVSIPLTGLNPGAVWHYRLVATNTVGIVYGSDRTFTTLLPPVAVTQPAIAISAGNATLKGAVNPNGTATSWQFEYGADTSYGFLAPALAGTTGAGSLPETVTSNLTGLPAGSTWHYRLKAVNSAGADYGDDMTFVTLSNIPAWRQQYFGTTADSGVAANNADPDGDGVVNLAEYGFGMNPTVRDSAALPRPTFNGTALIASFNQPLSVNDVTYGAEVSTNLINWSSIADSGSSSAHTFAAPFSTAGRHYMRLRVTLNP